ncbi:MAG: hypothetical protein OEN23_16035 [Paracoccaceae bacterium]|nr:hypothetical protein [Paracoccaceae bacterium]
MVSRLLLALGMFLLVSTLPGTGAAQMMCGDRDTIVARLAAQFGEVQQDRTPASQNASYELFGSKATGTWTMLLSGPRGKSCIVSAGESSGRAKPSPLARDGWPRPGALLVR